MADIFKAELKRGFSSYRYKTSLAISLIFPIFYIVVDLLPKMDKSVEAIKDKVAAYSTSTAYREIFTSNFGSGESIIFFELLPLLIALPYAITWRMDVKSGYINHLLIRCRKSKVLLVKYLVTFITGGAIAVIPQIVGFILVMMILPLNMPDQVMGHLATGRNLFSELYFTKLFLFVCLFLLVDFIYAGCLATLCITIGSIFDSVAASFCSAYLYIKCLTVIANFWGRGMIIQPAAVLAMAQGCPTDNIWILFIPIYPVLLAGIVNYLWARKNDLSVR